MKSGNKIKYTPAAADDLDEIFSYITLDNVDAAENMLHKLNSAIGKLADFTNMGAVLPEDDFTMLQRGYRFIVVHPYLVFYRVTDACIVIYRILHGRRDYLRQLFGSME